MVDVTSWGGTIRRYEVQPDPDRMRRYGITLSQLQNALANSNATVGGDYLNQGDVAMTGAQRWVVRRRRRSGAQSAGVERSG